MQPRGRPFELGNKLGRGRPKGSRNKTKSAVLELLERSEMAVVALVIRQAAQGHFPSQRLLLAVYATLPRRRSCRSRVRKMQSIEDLVSVAEQTTQEVSQGQITPEEANATMRGVEQAGQLLKMRSEKHNVERPPKAPLPEFMRLDIEARNEERAQRRAKEKAEKEALEGAAASPLKGDP
jgi:hypothetical protein